MYRDDLVLPTAVCPANSAPWRRLCLTVARSRVVLSLAVLTGGVLSPEVRVRWAVLAMASDALMGAAGWMNVAGTWRVRAGLSGRRSIIIVDPVRR